MKSGIYKITSPEGYVYIGQTKSFAYRFGIYRADNRVNRSHPRLYASFDEHGISKHTFSIVEECPVNMLDVRERYWQDHFDVIGENGLNCKLTPTPEKKGKLWIGLCQKMSEQKKGVPLSPEHKANVVAANAKLKGIKRPDWVCKRISEGKMGGTRKPATVEARKNLSNALKGKSKPPRTEEHNRNRAASFKKNMIQSGRQVHNAKIVFNAVTGIFYDTAKQAADAIGVSAAEMCLRLNGKRVKVQTPFQYV